MMVWSLTSHLEPDILECEVKWALGSITTNKARGGDEIPVELLQILKDDAVKMLHSIYQQIWKTQQWPQDWKMSFFIPIPKKGNAKACSNHCTIALISHPSKVMLKIFQARLQHYMNHELPDVQNGFGKDRGTRDQITNITGSLKKNKKNSRKASTSVIHGVAKSRTRLSDWTELNWAVLLKPGLENFEHYLTSVWDECNCAVVWASFGIAFLWYWSENWPFPVLWPMLGIPDL